MLRLQELVAKGDKMAVRTDPTVKILASTGEQLLREQVAARHSNQGIRRKDQKKVLGANGESDLSEVFEIYMSVDTSHLFIFCTYYTVIDYSE